MGEEIRKIIAERVELGYVSVKGFVEDAVRRRLEAIKGTGAHGQDAGGTTPDGQQDVERY